jgi:hypothetical protein
VLVYLFSIYLWIWAKQTKTKNRMLPCEDRAIINIPISYRVRITWHWTVFKLWSKEVKSWLGLCSIGLRPLSSFLINLDTPLIKDFGFYFSVFLLFASALPLRKVLVCNMFFQNTFLSEKEAPLSFKFWTKGETERSWTTFSLGLTYWYKQMAAWPLTHIASCCSRKSMGKHSVWCEVGTPTISLLN